jgi:hypothetical protein
VAVVDAVPGGGLGSGSGHRVGVRARVWLRVRVRARAWVRVRVRARAWVRVRIRAWVC